MFMLDTQQPKIRLIIARNSGFTSSASRSAHQIQRTKSARQPALHCLSTTAQQFHTASQQHCLSTISPQNMAAVQVPGGTEVTYFSGCCTKCPRNKVYLSHDVFEAHMQTLTNRGSHLPNRMDDISDHCS